jgi:hypothetical protein
MPCERPAHSVPGPSLRLLLSCPQRVIWPGGRSTRYDLTKNSLGLALWIIRHGAGETADALTQLGGER